MTNPTYCQNPSCPNHHKPPRGWYRRYGTYNTLAHGRIQRFQCRSCGRTCSTQTESLHYFAKRHVPFVAIEKCLVGGTPMREIARRYRLSPTAVANAVIRLGRQAMAGQIHLLHHLNARSEVVFDGIRSFITSKDFPCDLTTVIDRVGEVILTITHAIFRRGGTMTPQQKERIELKYEVWQPEEGSFTHAISLLLREIWDYLRPEVGTPGQIDTDEQPLYAALMKADPVTAFYLAAELLSHRRTPSTAPRSSDNPLFPANYIDRLIRHRVREHVRKTIAFGRNAVAQMHRLWIFAFDHNCRREWRTKRPDEGVHAAQGTVEPSVISKLTGEFHTRRIRITGIEVPESIHDAWTGKIPTPPHRWRKGQKGTDLHIPAFAVRDLVG